MWPTIIVILDEGGNTFPELMPIIGRIQIDIFLLDSTPETFYPNIVFTSASTVHTDTDMMLFQATYPIFTGILTALIGIYYFRCTMSGDTLFKKSDTIACREIITQSPADYESTIDIYNGMQIHKPTSHRDIRDIRTPNLVRAFRLNVSKQVWIYILRLTALREAFLRVYTFHTHDFHQTPDVLMIYLQPLKVEDIHKCPHASCRMLQQKSIHLFHQIHVCLRFSLGFIIEATSGYMHLSAKTVDAYTTRKILSKLHYLTFSPASSQAFAKKSFSILSSPTFFKSRSFSAFRCLTNRSCEVSGLMKAALAFCKNSLFHALIFKGDTLNSLANSFVSHQ